MQIYTPSCIIDLPLIIQFRPSRTSARSSLDRGAANYSTSYQREQKGREIIRSIITVLAKRTKRRRKTRVGPVAPIAARDAAGGNRRVSAIFSWKFPPRGKALVNDEAARLPAGKSQVDTYHCRVNRPVFLNTGRHPQLQQVETRLVHMYMCT